MRPLAVHAALVLLFVVGMAAGLMGPAAAVDEPDIGSAKVSTKAYIAGARKRMSHLISSAEKQMVAAGRQKGKALKAVSAARKKIDKYMAGMGKRQKGKVKRAKGKTMAAKKAMIPINNAIKAQKAKIAAQGGSGKGKGKSKGKGASSSGSGKSGLVTRLRKTVKKLQAKIKGGKAKGKSKGKAKNKSARKKKTKGTSKETKGTSKGKTKGETGKSKGKTKGKTVRRQVKKAAREAKDKARKKIAAVQKRKKQVKRALKKMKRTVQRVKKASGPIKRKGKRTPGFIDRAIARAERHGAAISKAARLAVRGEATAKHTTANSAIGKVKRHLPLSAKHEAKIVARRMNRGLRAVTVANKKLQKAETEVRVAAMQAKQQARKAKRVAQKQKAIVTATARKEKKLNAKKKQAAAGKRKGKAKGKVKVRPDKAVKKLMKQAVQAKKTYAKVKKGLSNVTSPKLAPTGRRKGKTAQQGIGAGNARCLACKAKCAHGDGACRSLCYVTQGGDSPCARG